MRAAARPSPRIVPTQTRPPGEIEQEIVGGAAWDPAGELRAQGRVERTDHADGPQASNVGLQPDEPSSRGCAGSGCGRCRCWASASRD
jgi:hypothetical protein